MELLGSNLIHLCGYDADGIRTGMVRTLKDFFEVILYWLMIGTATLCFLIFILFLAVLDLLTTAVNKLSRSKNND